MPIKNPYNPTANQMCAYLGEMSPHDFSSEDEIREYFSAENMVEMWGEQEDYSDAEQVMNAVIWEWKYCNRE